MKASSKQNSAQVFLFQGNDSYTSAQKVQAWRRAFEKKHSPHGVTYLDLEEADGGTTDLERIFSELWSGGGLFATARLFIVRGLFHRPAEEMEKFGGRLAALPPGLFIIFWEGAPVRKNLKLYKKLASLEKQGKAKIYGFEIPLGKNLEQFIKAYALKRGIKITAAAVERLAEAVGRDLAERTKTSAGYETKPPYDLWQVASELDKLKVFKKGRLITEADVEALVPRWFADNVFLLTQALGKKDRRLIQKYLDELVGSGMLPAGDTKSKVLPILGALAGQFRALLQLASARRFASSPYELAQLLGWSSFRVQMNLPLLQNFSETKISLFLRQLQEFDRKIKSTNLPPKVLLAQLIRTVV